MNKFNSCIRNYRQLNLMFQHERLLFGKTYTKFFNINQKYCHSKTQNPDIGNNSDHNIADGKKFKTPTFANLLTYLEKNVGLFARSDTELDEFFNNLEQAKQLANGESGSKINKLIQSNFDLRKSYYSPEWYQKKMFLTRQNSLLVGTNSALLFPDMNLSDRTVSIDFLVSYITAMVMGVLDYSNTTDVANLFYSYRVPETDVDVLKAVPTPNNTIVISRESNFFLIDLEDNLDQQSVYNILIQVFRFILNYEKPSSIPVGILSTMPRVDSNFGYQFLNESGLDRIREAKLFICLDQIDNVDEQKSSNKENQLQLAMKQIFLSDADNIGNRWFDRSLQMVFALNKERNQIYASGITFDRAQVNTQAVINLMEHTVDFLTQFKPPELEAENDILIKLHKLDLYDKNNSNSLDILNQSANLFALANYRKLLSQFDVQVLHFSDYGAENIVAHECFPESWIQVAINMALFKLCQQYQTLVPSYQRMMVEESGRLEATETSVNIQHPSLVQTFNEEMMAFLSDPFNAENLRIAMESHRFYYQLSLKGYNFNSLLHGYLNAVEDGVSTNEVETLQKVKNLLFDHPLMKRFLMPTMESVGFTNRYSYTMLCNSPTIFNGINCSYNFGANQILFTLSYLNLVESGEHNPNEQLLAQFKSALDESLMHIKTVMSS